MSKYELNALPLVEAEEAEDAAAAEEAVDAATTAGGAEAGGCTVIGTLAGVANGWLATVTPPRAYEAVTVVAVVVAADVVEAETAVAGVYGV